MRILDPETWAEIRAAYVDTAEPIRQIAARFGIAYSTLRKHAKKVGWPPRKAGGTRARPHPPARHAGGAGAHVVTEQPVSRRPDEAAARIRRMLGIIDLQLDQMESRMTSGQPLTTQDEERQARAFGAITANLEKVTEAAADLSRAPGQDGASGPVSLDAERMRREIAERLERLNAQWLARERSR